MKYSDLQTHIEKLKPKFKEAENRYLAPIQKFDLIENMKLPKADYREFSIRPRKLGFEKTVSKMFHIRKNMDPEDVASLVNNLVGNLSWNDLKVPSNEEMSRLIDESGIGREDIIEYSRLHSTAGIKGLADECKASIVFFLSKVLFDAISGKSFDTLRKVNCLMLELGLIPDLSGKIPFWKESVSRVIDHHIEKRLFLALQSEFDSVIEEKIGLFTAVSEDIEKRTLETMQHMMFPSHVTFSADDYIDDELREMRIQYSENRADFGEIIAEVIDDIDELKLKIARDEEELGKHVDPVAVSEGLYASILEGEELVYVPYIHKLLALCFARQAFPQSQLGLKPLPDDGIWNDSPEAGNGRKASNIFSQGDLLEVEYETHLDRKPFSCQCTIPIRSYIAQMSGVSVPESIDVRMSIVHRLKEYGLSDRKARDIAVVIAAYRARNDLGDPSQMDKTLSNLFPEEKQENVENLQDEKEIEVLEGRIADLEARLKTAEKEKKGYRHDIVGLERKIEELEERHEREIDQILEDTQYEDEQEEAHVSDIEYPYHTERKITLYGGFDVFHRELSKLMPDIKIVEPCYKTPNLDVFRNSDMVFIQPNKLNHGNYFSVRDAAKRADVPYFHLRYACARKCADFMVEEIEKAENARGANQ